MNDYHKVIDTGCQSLASLGKMNKGKMYLTRKGSSCHYLDPLVKLINSKTIRHSVLLVMMQDEVPSTTYALLLPKMF